MSIQEIISDIVNMIENPDYDKSRSFPDIITTRSGKQITYVGELRYKIELIAIIIKDNLPNSLKNISYKSLYEICRDSICDLYTENILHEGIIKNNREHIKTLKKEIHKRIEESLMKLTHNIPANTCLFPFSESVLIGPVTIYSNLEWVKHIELNKRLIQDLSIKDEDLTTWKEEIIKLASPLEPNETKNSIAYSLYEKIKKSNSVLKIEIEYFEFELSVQLAKISAQTALDSFSLIFNNKNVFIQQNLYSRPTPPIRFDILISHDNELTFARSHLTERVPMYNGDDISKLLKEQSEFINAAGKIINSVINKNPQPHKSLSIRWTTSLNWYSEAQREQDDAIALAKIGISLDVLSGGGEWLGILKMVKNVLKIDDQFIIFEHPEKTALREFISDLYNKGRSQIVHGNHIDKLIPFEEQRKKASLICREILMASAKNLIKYNGNESHDAFVKMTYN